jgi:hypothetical protein
VIAIMVEQADILLSFWQEQRAQARQSEDQRATLSNLTLAFAAVSLALVGQWGLELRTLAVTIPLVPLGLYGALACAKYYERNGLHLEQAKRLADLLCEVSGLENYESMMAPVRSRYSSSHRIMSRVRLYAMWISLHLALAVLGAVLTIVVLASK